MIVYIPHSGYLKSPNIDRPSSAAGWAGAMTTHQPVVWLRMNTSSGTENNLGSGGGTVQWGAAVTRNSSGGPVVGGGYATAVNTASTNTYIRSQVTTMWSTFTVGAFVKLPASGNSSGAVIFSKKEYYASAYTTFPFAVEWDQPNTRLVINLDNGTDFVADQTVYTPNSSIPTAQWNFIVIVVRPTGNPIEVYLNGSLIQSTTASTTITTSSTVPVWACAQANEYSSGVGASDCAGDYAEFFVCNKAMTGTDVSELYAARNGA